MRSYSPRKLPPLAIVAGIRTPFAKAFTTLSEMTADELGCEVVAELLRRCPLTDESQVDEVIFGNVSGPAESANIARVISLKAGLPQHVAAHTVNRNCASGLEALFSAWQTLREGRAEVIVAGGTESMSNVPLLVRPEMKNWLMAFNKAGLVKRVALFAKLRLKMLSPQAGLELGLTDSTCGLNMGQTAEILAKRFSVSRAEQDSFALSSHRRAAAAWERCFYKGEVMSLHHPALGPAGLATDVGIRPKQSLEALAKLQPIFDRKQGTVTAGNSCPITDGAAALLVMTSEKASELGMHPIGYVRGYAVAGCDPRQMGLGPVFAIHRLLQESQLTLRDFELIEINEAFAAQVIACVKAANSRVFSETELGTSQPLGEIDLDRLNVNGGAIALGHPVGTSGTRLVLTLLRALKERGLNRGLASLCVGGGQGAAVWVELNQNLGG